MVPSISSTILHVRYGEHANSKSVPSSPIWRYRYTQPQYSVQYRQFHKNRFKWQMGWFYVCAQPMRDSVTLWRRLSLAGRKPRISPGKTYLYYCRSLASIYSLAYFTTVRCTLYNLSMVQYSPPIAGYINTVTVIVRSLHNFAHVTTAHLLWHVEICGLSGSAK